MLNKNLPLLILLIILFSGIGFFAGSKYQQSRSPAFPTFNRNNDRMQIDSNRPAGFRGGQILGEIIESDQTSVTVKLPDGSSKIILISGSTNINQAASATLADLKVGTKIAAFGSANSDGSISASNIQINPIDRIPTIQK